jgi:hypothetical protein
VSAETRHVFAVSGTKFSLSLHKVHVEFHELCTHIKKINKIEAMHRVVCGYFLICLECLAPLINFSPKKEKKEFTHL